MVAEKLQQRKGQMVPHGQAGTQPHRGMLETEQGNHTSQSHPSNIRSHEERDLENAEDEEIQVKHRQILMLVTIVGLIAFMMKTRSHEPIQVYFM